MDLQRPIDICRLATVVFGLTLGILTVFWLQRSEFRAADQANHRNCFSKSRTRQTETKKTEIRGSNSHLLKKTVTKSARQPQTGKRESSKPQHRKGKKLKKPPEDQDTCAEEEWASLCPESLLHGEDLGKVLFRCSFRGCALPPVTPAYFLFLTFLTKNSAASYTQLVICMVNAYWFALITTLESMWPIHSQRVFLTSVLA